MYVLTCYIFVIKWEPGFLWLPHCFLVHAMFGLLCKPFTIAWKHLTLFLYKLQTKIVLDSPNIFF